MCQSHITPTLALYDKQEYDHIHKLPQGSREISASMYSNWFLSTAECAILDHSSGEFDY